jgi:hypothetical protein
MEQQEAAMTLTLLLLAACSGQDTAGEGTGPVDEFEATLTDLEARTTEHYHAVIGMTDPDGIDDEEDAFWGTCQGLWDDAGSCWDRMKECDGGHGMGGMMGGEDDDWDGWMHDVWDTMRDHHDAMAHCAEAATCHDTERAWHETMSEMFGHMHGMDRDWPEDCHW